MQPQKLLKWTFIIISVMLSILEIGAQQKRDVFHVVAYQKYNTMGQFNPKAYAYIDQLIYKLIRPKSDGSLELLPSTLSNLKLLRNGKLEYKDVKLLIGIGGANMNSEYFSVMAANSESRKEFVNSTLEFCMENQLDGADIDWEYPKTKKDKDNAVILFKELNKAFIKNNLFLTAAITYTPNQVRFAKRIENYVSQINLMVYEPMEGLDTFQEQIDFALKLIHKEDMNLKKLVLGLPFYGKNLINGKTIAYNKIIESKALETVGFDRLDYMDINKIKTNVENIKRQGLSGIMFWELGFDTSINSTTSLLKGIHAVLE